MPRRDFVPLNALLKGLEVDRVDFVGAGANGQSDIVLFKSHRGTRYVPKTNGGTMPELKKSDAEIAAEGAAAIQKAIDEAVAAATAKQAEDLAALAAPAPASEPDAPTVDDATAKAIAKAVGDAVAVEKARADALAVDVAKLQDERADAIFLAKGATLPAIGSPTDVANVLKAVAKSDPNAAEQVETMLKAANERLTQSGLLTSLGAAHGGDTSGDPQTVLMNKAQALIAADPTMTLDAALTKAVAEDPGAYDSFRKSFKDAG